MPIHINAKQANIKQIFADSYVIPVYQRPYSWKEEECEQLFNDIYDVFEKSSQESYFIGNIIIAEKESEERKEVIDGQQRLTTLSLLLKALYRHDARNDDLKNALYIVDSRDSDTINGYRIESKIMGGQEKIFFENIIHSEKSDTDENEKEDNNYQTNYNFFLKKLKDTKEEEIQKLADYIMKFVILLPILCENTEKALTIFETINNRGLDLTDADMFKAKLYEIAKRDNQENEFIKQWDKFVEKTEKLWTDYKILKKNPTTYIFRIYMYYLKGSYRDLTKQTKLRDFFSGHVLNLSKSKVYNDNYNIQNFKWKETLKTLDEIVTAWDYILQQKNQLRAWFDIIEYFGNDEPFIPVLLKIHSHINFKKEMPDKDRKDSIDFIKNIARYCYSKGFYKNLEGSTVQDEMLKATSLAVKNETYNPVITLDKNFKPFLKLPIKSNRFKKGFSAIHAYLNPKQKYVDVTAVQVEHILPKSWNKNYYDTWNENNVKFALDTIGNLMLLEKSQNIKGSNQFFANKVKKSYSGSSFLMAQELAEKYNSGEILEWKAENYVQKQNETCDTLIKFFEGKI